MGRFRRESPRSWGIKAFGWGLNEPQGASSEMRNGQLLNHIELEAHGEDRGGALVKRCFQRKGNAT